MKRSLLINGDAVSATGFARATHKITDILHHSYNIDLLGINYWGEPHNYPYRIHPANPGGHGDSWGLWRIKDMLQAIRPDALVLQNDPWNVVEYVQRFAGTLPIIAFMPVDGKNCAAGKKLNGLALAIFYTQFALDEARKGGYEGPATVIGLGVDRAIYRPIPQKLARAKTLGNNVPEGAFIVGNVNRNQPRKRMDLSVAYFAEWIKRRNITDAYLYLHLAPTGDKGWDVRQLARYYGISNRLIVPKNTQLGVGVSEEFLAHVMAGFDVGINTGWGEGFGLTTLEMMSCGIPQIVGDWSALGEWAAPAAMLIPCTSTTTMWNDVNVIGGIADRELFIEALDQLYRDRDLRAAMGADSVALASQMQFNWTEIGLTFGDAIESALAGAGNLLELPSMPHETEPLS